MEKKFCGECWYLTPKEVEQEDSFTTHIPHWCLKYKKRVYHLNDHPKINRLPECEHA